MSKISVIIGLALVLCILACGCTHAPVQQPVASPTSTPMPASTGTVQPVKTIAAGLVPTIYPLVPGPVQTVPEYESVTVSVNRNTITENPTITVTYNGGKGLGMTEEMSVYVIRADGSQVSGFVLNPKMGSTVTLMGDTGTDQVIVYITMTSGITYKVIDKNYPFINQM